MQRLEVEFPSGPTYCAGTLYKPPGEGPHPAVILAQGLGMPSAFHMPRFAERFAEAGIAALIFDYRHFGDSPGIIRRLIHVQRQIQDLSAAMDFMDTRDDIHPSRVTLWGTSLGAGHALRVASMDARVAALILQTPFVSGSSFVRAMDRSAVRMLALLTLRDQVRRLRGESPIYVKTVGAPSTRAVITATGAIDQFTDSIPVNFDMNATITARSLSGLRYYFPARAARRIQRPVLLCLAEKDNITPPESLESLKQMISGVEEHVYPCGHYELFQGEMFRAVIEDQIAFVQKHFMMAQGQSIKNPNSR